LVMIRAVTTRSKPYMSFPHIAVAQIESIFKEVQLEVVLLSLIAVVMYITVLIYNILNL